MTTFITGGGSQTGTSLAKLLANANHKVLFGSRSGLRIPEGFQSVKFDWTDASTFEAPFAADSNIQYIYALAPPGTGDALTLIKPFLDFAVAKGVKNVVLLSGSALTDEGPLAAAKAALNAYLDGKGIDYVILRPTWFLENFLKRFAPSIKEKNVIETVAPNGRIPFIAVDDIAQAAFVAITDRAALKSKEPFVVHTEVAEIFSTVLGRKITHKTITKDELVRTYVQAGIPEQFAGMLATFEVATDNGTEFAFVSHPSTYNGKIGVKEWIEKNQSAFA